MTQEFRRFMFGSEQIIEATCDGQFVVVRSEDLQKNHFKGPRTKHFLDATNALSSLTNNRQKALCYADDSYDPKYFIGVNTNTLMSFEPVWFAGILTQFELQQRTDKPEDRITHPGFLAIAKILWERDIYRHKIHQTLIEERNKLSTICQGGLACDLDP